MYFRSDLRPDLPGAPFVSLTAAVRTGLPDLQPRMKWAGRLLKLAKEVPNA